MHKVVWVLVVVFGLLLILSIALPFIAPPASGHMDRGGYGGMMGPWGMYGGYGAIRGVVTVLFIALLIAGVFWLVQSTGKAERGGPPTSEPPLDILKRRYAAGEITKVQFEEMKRDLGL
jgi:putative membrane protein